jgi:hypothetical protein
MNFMSYYGPRSRGRGAPWAVTLLGWQPWAIARVAAFATLGVILAERRCCSSSSPRRREAQGHQSSRVRRAAMSRIPTDWFLKFLLAPTWGRWLRSPLP